MVQSVPPSTFQYSDGVTKKQNQLQKPWEARHSSALCDTWHITFVNIWYIIEVWHRCHPWLFQPHETLPTITRATTCQLTVKKWSDADSVQFRTFHIHFLSFLCWHHQSMTDNVNFLSRNSSSGFAASSSPLQSRSPRPGIHPVHPRKEQSEDS